MEQAKSLLEVKDGLTFLDIIARQVLELRAQHGARLPLVLMNSFSTREDTLAALAQHPDLDVRPARSTSSRTRSRRSASTTCRPVEWPRRPGARVVPARPRRPLHRARDLGHARARCSTRLRVRVHLQLRQPRRGARPAHPRLVRRRGAPVPDGGHRRTEADRKGGHLARRKDGRAARAARDRADARRGPRRASRTSTAAPLLQHEQPVGRPARAGRRRCASATACSGCR